MRVRRAVVLAYLKYSKAKINNNRTRVLYAHIICELLVSSRFSITIYYTVIIFSFLSPGRGTRVLRVRPRPDAPYSYTHIIRAEIRGLVWLVKRGVRPPHSEQSRLRETPTA